MSHIHISCLCRRYRLRTAIAAIVDVVLRHLVTVARVSP